MNLPASIGQLSTYKKVRLTGSGWIVSENNTLVNSWTYGDIEVKTGTDRLLLIWALIYNPTVNTDITAVSRNGQAFTEVGTAIGVNNDFQFSLWRRIAPSEGNFAVTYTFDNSLVSGHQIMLGWASLVNVDQTTPLGTRATASNASSNYPIIEVNLTDSVIDGYALAGLVGLNFVTEVPQFTSGKKQTRLHYAAASQNSAGCLDTQTPADSSQSFYFVGQNMGANLDFMTIAIPVWPS